MKPDQNVWLKRYIGLNTDLRKKVKNGFEKALSFFKLMINAVLRKTMGNVIKHRYIVLATNERRNQNQIIIL